MRQDEPSQTDDDRALTNCFVGVCRLISVALLHTRFIGAERRSGPASAFRCLVCKSVWYRPGEAPATPGLISSLPGTAGLPPFISFSTSCL